MKTNRAFTLLGVLLLVACAGTAAWLDRWFMDWQGNRAKNYNPLNVAVGTGQKIFAGHFYRKADVYFHSGMYPSIFDNNESFKTAHIGEDAGATVSKNTGDEENYLGQSRDISDRFSRNFFPSQHTHLDQGGATHSHGGTSHRHEERVIELGDGQSGEVREVLPWLKLAQELDPEDPLTYTVAAYWLRDRMNKAREAELLLREGLKHLPHHPSLLFELGRIHFEKITTRPARAMSGRAPSRNGVSRKHTRRNLTRSFWSKSKRVLPNSKKKTATCHALSIIGSRRRQFHRTPPQFRHALMNFAKNNSPRPLRNEMLTTMKTAEERLRWALEICRKAQMRGTPVREGILFFLATQRLPVSLETVSRSEKINGRCNATTIYRTLMMFKEAGIVRLVGTPQKASYFLLNAPGEKNHFLICRRCGCTTELPLPASMCKSISQIAIAQGFSTAEQDCEVYGYCRNCETIRQREIAPSKLSA